MKVIRSFGEARSHAKGVVGLVPTMGFLHEGHLSLIEAARSQCDTVVVSLFVNPLQFDETDDLERYPRNEERDAEYAADAGADILFAPTLEDMYPSYPATRVRVDALARTLEGRFRPNHFEGVATVVTKLLAGLGPDLAFFGRKDAQQLAIVRRLVADLSLPTEIVGRPIVRERDGLALSSRNIFLSDEERAAALGIYRGLMKAVEAVEEGERSAPALDAIVLGELRREPLLTVDYAELNDAADVVNLIRLDRDCFLAVAARVPSTRLIDNVHFFVNEDDVEADVGVKLARDSILMGPD